MAMLHLPYIRSLQPLIFECAIFKQFIILSWSIFSCLQPFDAFKCLFCLGDIHIRSEIILEVFNSLELVFDISPVFPTHS